jgi:predicted RNase H-like nuclease (RuvC/YqgF family)
MPSEKLYGIIPQPDNTCPLIDEVIEKIRQCQEILKEIDSNPYTTPQKVAIEVDSILSDLVYDRGKPPVYLEAIRARAGDIRDWGQEWKDLAKKYNGEISDLEDTIKEYKEEIREYKREIDYLKADQEELHKQIDRAANSY